MKPMKVLLITSGYPNPWKPHAGVFVKRQVDILERSGLCCFEILTTGDSRKGLFISLKKYIVLMIRTFYYSSVKRFDLIHAHAIFPTGLIAMIPKWFRGKKLVITIHGGIMHSIEHKNNLFRSLILFPLRRADKLIAVSHHLRQQVANLCGIEEENIELINMGVDREKFFPKPNGVARKALGLMNLGINAKMIIFVGNLIEVKGGAYLIEAAEILKNNSIVQNFDIFIVGHGPEREMLERLSVLRNVQDKVRFVGNKAPDEIPLWMAAADVLVVPSLAEGFGLVALEGMACGTPVVATNVGGLQEFVKDNFNSLVVERANSEDLAEKLHMLLEDRDLYNRLAENCLQTALQHDAEQQSIRIGRIYQDLLKTNA